MKRRRMEHPLVWGRICERVHSRFLAEKAVTFFLLTACAFARSAIGRAASWVASPFFEQRLRERVRMAQSSSGAWRRSTRRSRCYRGDSATLLNLPVAVSIQPETRLPSASNRAAETELPELFTPKTRLRPAVLVWAASVLNWPGAGLVQPESWAPLLAENVPV